MSRLRTNINIELVDGAKHQLESVRSRNGMTQKEMVGRLINWFCQQDEVIQQIILGQIPAHIAPDVATIVLKRLLDRRGTGDAASTGAAGAMSLRTAPPRREAVAVGAE